ncbi:uncharacterized protein [Amphiura filiformis]|uniref:uncharacterized protein isoform X1 n=1 Tax=Amphiura filiformis TaxID=82378 RepID=UPI003B2101E8
MTILRAVTPIGRCIMCRSTCSKDPEKNAGSENTERTSDQTNTPTHHPSTTSGSVRHHEVHLDELLADKGYDNTRMNGIPMDHTPHNMIKTSPCKNKVEFSNASHEKQSAGKQYEELDEENPERQPLYTIQTQSSPVSTNLKDSTNKTETQPVSSSNNSNNTVHTPVQVETSKAPASPTTRTRRVGPSDGTNGNTATPV